MIRFKLFGTEFRTHILALIAMALAYMLGLGTEIPYILLAVSVHEAAHLAVAKLCGMEIEYVEVMCLGGAIKLKDMYSAGRLRLFFVAIAGPAANILMAFMAAAMAWWGIISFYPAWLTVRINIILMIFNLMPALPLDGGRALYAVSSIWLPRKSAMRLCAVAAYLLAILLVCMAVWGWYTVGTFNITLVIMAVFITASAMREMEESASPERIIAAMCSDIPAYGKANIALLSENTSPAQAAAYISKHIPTIFAVSDGVRITELIPAEEMARRIMHEA